MVRIPFINRSRGNVPPSIQTNHFEAGRKTKRSALQNAIIETLEERRLMSVSLISVNSAGVAANGASDEASVSSDGTFVAFSSYATNLGGTVQGGIENIYLRDTATNTTTLVSAGLNGAASNGSSNSPKVSANGQFVVYASAATNLAANDHNKFGNVYLWNSANDTTTCLTGNANGFSGEPVISADGTEVAFSSYADDFTSNANNGHNNVYEINLSNNHITLVSTAAGTTNAANGTSYDPSISGGGSYVTFRSTATNLENSIPITNPGDFNIYVSNVGANSISLVSVDAAGTASGNGNSISGQTSDNGQYIVFRSAATNLVSDDNSNQDQVYLRNTVSNATTLLSSDFENIGAGGGLSEYPSISDDGRYAAFSSTADNLIANDTNTKEQVYVRDLQTGALYLISVDNSSGAPANAASYHTYESSNGQYVSFTSAATDLVSQSNNGVTQVYIATAPSIAQQQSDTTPPTASVPASQLTPTVGSTTYDFTVDLADNVALNTQTIGPLTVTGPAGTQTATYVSEVGSGTSAVATYQITFPSAITDSDAGTYTVLVPAGSIKDAAGNDLTAGHTPPVNIGSFALTVPSAQAPDLTGAFVGKLPVSVIGGKKGSVKLVVTNVGVNPIVKTKLSFALYVSETPGILPGATPVKTVTSKLSLKHGKSASIKFSNFVYPGTLPNGQYYLVAQLDSTDVLVETNRANSTVATTKTITVAPPFKALSATSVVPSTATLVPGGKAIAIISVKNAGNVAATGPLTIDLTAPTGAGDISGTGEAIATVVTKINVKPGATAKLKIKYTVSPSAAAESGFLSATIDPANIFKNPDQDANIATSATGISVT